MIDFTRAREAADQLKNASNEEKSAALLAVAGALSQNAEDIAMANALDLAALGQDNTAFADRLAFGKERISATAEDMKKVATLPDPTGRILAEWDTENGLHIEKTAVPYGVIGVIYEARPNVTADVFALCLKSGNACVLKGGKEAAATNAKLVEIIKGALAKTSLSPDTVTLLPADRAVTEELIRARGRVDLIVPRGGKGLIDYVVQNSLVPVIETGAGVCHTYVEKSADLETAFAILQNAKMQRPSVCNACETLLLDREIAAAFLPLLKTRIPELLLRGDADEVARYGLLPLPEGGYFTEYGRYEISVKTVVGVEDAVRHINHYGTHHSDCICTQDEEKAAYFMKNVDSACVYHNASTRFSDGGCFGFGAELGISTQKNPPRGPMGLAEMTTYQYRIHGKGQIRN